MSTTTLIQRRVERRAALGLTAAEVIEFQQIMREECGVNLDDAEAWARARELANLYRALLGPLPEDLSNPVSTDSSNVVALALPATGKVR